MFQMNFSSFLSVIFFVLIKILTFLFFSRTPRGRGRGGLHGQTDHGVLHGQVPARGLRQPQDGVLRGPASFIDLGPAYCRTTDIRSM